jgi:hypothetical protein
VNHAKPSSRQGCRDPVPGMASSQPPPIVSGLDRLRSGFLTHCAVIPVWMPGSSARDGERAAKPDDCVLDSALPSLALDSGIPAGMTEARGGMTQDKVAPTGMPQDKGVLAGKPGTTLSRHPGWDAGIQAKSSSRPGCRDPGQGGQARSRRQSSRVWIPRRAQPAPGR